MESELISCNKNNSLWTVTLNRPEKANALSIGMLQALKSIFNEASKNSSLRTLVVTGAGTRVFSAGADLSELVKEADHFQDTLWDEVSESLNTLPVFTIALINGHCIGGALTLALGCDVRVSVPEASFSYPVLKNEILPGAQDAERLRRLIGPGRTSALLLGGQKTEAEQALNWGLVDYLVEPKELEKFVDKLSQTAHHAGREHLATMKQLCRGA